MTIFSGHDLICVRGERCVFAGLNFSLGQGEALLLTGPNGSGKSSLLRLMAGLLRPAKGQIAWNGENIIEDPETHNGRLHYVGHQDAIKPVLSAEENLCFWAALRTSEPKLDLALQSFGIGHLSKAPGKFLSAGQKRRAGLARIIAAHAPLWLLDEPATALDAAAIKSLEAIIVKHRESGGMVVASTHAPLAIASAKTLDLAKFASRQGGLKGTPKASQKGSA